MFDLAVRRPLDDSFWRLGGRSVIGLAVRRSLGVLFEQLGDRSVFSLAVRWPIDVFLSSSNMECAMRVLGKVSDYRPKSALKNAFPSKKPTLGLQ